MDYILNILILEDDTDICQSYLNIAENYSDVNIVSVTNDYQKAVDDTLNQYVNCVILDLELHHGNGTGFDYLRKINDSSIINRPYIMAVTNNTSSVTIDAIKRQGVDFTFPKYNNNYSEKAVLELLLSIKDTIIASYNKKASRDNYNDTKPNLSPEIIKQKKIKYLSDIFLQLCITPNLKGFIYLIDAILLYEENPNCKYCEVIATSYKKTSASVDRAMQTAISRAWTRGDIEKLLNYYPARFSPDSTKPTVMEFVSVFAAKLKSFNS